MKWLVLIIAGLIVAFSLSTLFHGGHSPENAERTRAVACSKNAWNACVAYAIEHDDTFPESYDLAFLNRCVDDGIFKPDELDDHVLPNAKPGTTGFVLMPGKHLKGKGAGLLLITTEPVNEDVYATVAVSGKAEALPAAEVLSRILTDFSQQPAVAPPHKDESPPSE